MTIIKCIEHMLPHRVEGVFRQKLEWYKLNQSLTLLMTIIIKFTPFAGA